MLGLWQSMYHNHRRRGSHVPYCVDLNETDIEHDIGVFEHCSTRASLQFMRRYSKGYDYSFFTFTSTPCLIIRLYGQNLRIMNVNSTSRRKAGTGEPRARRQ